MTTPTTIITKPIKMEKKLKATRKRKKMERTKIMVMIRLIQNLTLKMKRKINRIIVMKKILSKRNLWFFRKGEIHYLLYGHQVDSIWNNLLTAINS